MIHHITRATRHFIFWSLLAGAILLTGLRLFLVQIENYKSDLETRGSEIVGAPVKIGKLRANIYGLKPTLTLKGIDVLQPDSRKPIIQLQEIRLKLDLLDTLLGWDVLAATTVTILGAQLSVKRKLDGGISIVGLQASEDQPLWLLQRGRYEVLGSEVLWQDEKRHAEQHQFSDVDIYINNELDADQHQINIAMNLPDTFGETLTLSMQFTGDIFQPGKVNGQLYAEGKGIQLAEMASGDLPMGMIIDSGETTFKLWSNWRNSTMVSLMGEIQAKQTNISLNHNILPVERVASQFRMQRNTDQWVLDVVDFTLQTPERTWAEADFSVWVKGTKANPVQQFAANVANMEIEEAIDLILFSSQLSAQHTDLLNKLDLQGQLQNLSLFVDVGEQKLAVNGAYQGISMAAVKNFPGIENFSGSIYGTELSGYLRLDSHHALLALPNLFAESIQIEQLSGKLAWLQTEENWQISSQMLQLDSADIETRNKVHIALPKNAGQIFLDLQTYFFNGKDVSRVKYFLPKGKFRKKTRQWLDNAFIAGSISQGNVIFYGNIADYPFAGGQGVFEILYELKGGELRYASTWPNVTEIDAEILFYQKSLQVDFKHARVNGATVKHALGTIDVLGKSGYGILKGQVDGTIEQTLGFLQQTPLHTKVNPVLESISPQGDNIIDVEIKIPFFKEVKAEVNGVAHLTNAQLTVLPLDLPVQKINGDLHFNEHGVFSENIDAQALGFPIQVQIDRDLKETLISVNGSTDIENLHMQFPSTWWKLAKGQTDYELRLNLPDQQDNQASLILTSDLLGFALDLPAPLGKHIGEKKPLELTFSMTDEALLPVKMDYIGNLQAAMTIEKAHRELYSGHVVFGSGEAEFTLSPGIKLEVNRDEFALQPWLAVIHDEENTQDSANKLSAMILNTPHFYWQKSDLGALELEALNTDNKWQGKINSQFGQGSFSFAAGLASESKISLDLQRLNLVSLGTVQGPGDSLSPLDFPLLDIKSRQVFWRSVNLGELKLKSSRVADGMVFSQFEMRTGKHRLSLPGSSWKMKNGRSVTGITGVLEMDSLGDFLSQLKVTNDMKETRAMFDFSLYWPGAPYEFSVADVAGLVDINFEEGRLLGVEPGIGRLLGALDIAQLDRRLQLDFRDVYQKGLRYDGIRGSFKLANGYAQTQNLTVDAIAAKISITGKTGLVTQDYDQIVTVIPKSSAAIPIAGTIMHGLTTFVVQSLTGDRKEGLFISSQYAMKGKWGEAEIFPLHENDGLLQKAWTGLTDFSWISNKRNNIENKYE